MKRIAPYGLPTLETDEMILQTVDECGHQGRAAEKLGVSVWTVRRAVARAGPKWFESLARVRAIDVAIGLIDRIPQVIEDMPPGYRWKGVVNLLELMLRLAGAEISDKATRQLQQTIVNISHHEAQSLKDTIDSVEGEIVDDGDT